MSEVDGMLMVRCQVSGLHSGHCDSCDFKLPLVRAKVLRHDTSPRQIPFGLSV